MMRLPASWRTPHDKQVFLAPAPAVREPQV